MDTRKRLTFEIIGGMALLGLVGLYTGSKIADKKEDTTYDNKIVQLEDREQELVSKYNTLVPKYNNVLENSKEQQATIQDQNEEIAKLNNAAGWWQSEFNKLEDKYAAAQSTVDSLETVASDADVKIADLEKSLATAKTQYESAAKERDEYFASLKLANDENAALEDSLSTAFTWLNVYVVNDWCIPPVQQRHLDRNHLPESFRVVPDSREAVKEIKEQNKLYKKQE